MTGTGVIHVLLVGNDARIRDELEVALAGARSGEAVLHEAPDFRRGVEAARARRPDVVVAALGNDAGALRALAAELRAAAPDALVAAAYRTEDFASREQESAFLLEAIRGNVHDFLRRPVSSAELAQVMARVHGARAGGGGREARGQLCAFHSTKGGVGKSTLAVSTACVLAQRHPDRVLLVDASLQLGVCAVALDLPRAGTVADAARERDRLDGTLLRQLAGLHPCGLRVLAAPEDAVDAAEIDAQTLARILTLAQRHFDFVIVDTFPMVDELMLTVIDLCDLVYLVNQGTVPDVIGGAHLLRVLARIGLPATRRRLVLNHNHPPVTGALTAADVEARLGVRLDHEIPYDKRVVTGLNLGEPWVLSAPPRRGFGRSVRAIAAEIESVGAGGETPPAPAKESVLARLAWRWRTST